MSKATISLYGNIKIERGVCPECKSTAFIKHGKYQCCGCQTAERPAKYHREMEAPTGRKLPPKADRDAILEQQDNRCFYCGVRFGGFRTRHGRLITIKLAWDHQLPYSLTYNNQASNFVAACSVCNGIKSDKVFQEVSEAQIYIADTRRRKGYDW